MKVKALDRVIALFKREEPPDRVPIFELMIDPKTINGILPDGTYEDLVEALDIDCVVSPTPSKMFGKTITITNHTKSKGSIQRSKGCSSKKNSKNRN